MASEKPTRDLLRILLNNFINSLKPRQIRGNYVGEDYFGNKYYEIPANSSAGKAKRSRWFEPPVKDAFDHEMAAEWEAWLRGRREEAPTREELVKNLQITETTRRNAAEVEALHRKATDDNPRSETIGKFPKYKDYEHIPGHDPFKKN